MKTQITLAFFLLGLLVYGQEEEIYDSIFYKNTVDALEQGHTSKDAVLVISGGGARGAWGAGLISGMNDVGKFNFKHVVATSTGALMAPFIARDKWLVLEKYYTGRAVKKVLRPNIYDTDKESMKFFPLLTGLIKNKNSFSSSLFLRSLIEDNFTTDDFAELSQKYAPNAEVAVHSLDLGMTLYKGPKEVGMSRDQYIDWIWASANQPVFMTPLSTFNQTKLISSSIPNSNLLKAPESPADRQRRIAWQEKIDALPTKRKLRKHRKKKNRKRIAVLSDPFAIHQSSDFEFPISSTNYFVDGGVGENLPLMRGLHLAAQDSIKNIVVVVNNKAPFAFYDAPLLSSPDSTENLRKWLAGERDYERLTSSFFIGLDQLKLLFDPPVKHEGGFLIDYLGLVAEYDHEEERSKFLGRKFNKRKVHGLISILLAAIDGFSKEILINDIKSAIMSPLAQDVVFHFYFMPLAVYEANPSSFGFDQKRMKQAFEIGRQAKLIKQFDPEMSRGFALYFITGSFDQRASEYLQRVEAGDVLSKRM